MKFNPNEAALQMMKAQLEKEEKEAQQYQQEYEQVLGTMIAPYAEISQFLPIFIIAVIGTMLVYLIDAGAFTCKREEKPLESPREFCKQIPKVDPLISIFTLQENEPRSKKDDGKMISLEELRQQKFWICVKGTVYDVSKSQVYQKGKKYAALAGQDASFALATMRIHENFKTEWRKCCRQDLIRLHEWSSYFKLKYPVVGYLQEIEATSDQ